MPVEKKMREVYYSPRRRRHFMTKIGAANAEANTRMHNLFPPEDAEYDEQGWATSPSWDFRYEPRLVAVRDRLVARYMKALG